MELVFKPPLERIRQNYFKGFGGNGSINKKMAPRNSKRLVQFYFKEKGLFEKLIDVHSEWFKIGQIGLTAYIDLHVKTSDDYVAEVKALKAKRRR